MATISDTLRLEMGIGGLLSFVGVAIELLIAGSHAADGAGIFILDSNDNIINGNDSHVNQNESGILLLGSSNHNTIRNNRANGNSNYGIRINDEGGSGNLLQANTAVLNEGADLADWLM